MATRHLSKQCVQPGGGASPSLRNQAIPVACCLFPDPLNPVCPIQKEDVDMLKAFRELALTGPRLPEPEVVRAGVMAAGRFLGLAGVAFLLGRAVLAAVGPMCALAPFAIALFAAGLTAGLNPAPLLAGCVLGAVGPGLRAFNLALPLGCAVVLAGSLIRSAVGPRLGRLWGPKLRARSPNPEAAAGMVLAGLGVLMPGLFYAGGALWPSA